MGPRYNDRWNTLFKVEKTTSTAWCCFSGFSVKLAIKRSSVSCGDGSNRCHSFDSHYIELCGRIDPIYWDFWKEYKTPKLEASDGNGKSSFPFHLSSHESAFPNHRETLRFPENGGQTTRGILQHLIHSYQAEIIRRQQVKHLWLHDT